MAKRTPLTPEERQARMDALHTQLSDAVARIQSGDDFKRYLQIQARFHSYSANNVILIYSQMPHATRVAGFGTWLKLGRFVRKGEKGIAIFAPRRYAIKDEVTGEVAGMSIRGFQIEHVFDISQTEGEELPDLDVPRFDGDDDFGLRDALLEFADTIVSAVTVSNYDPHTDGDDTRSSYGGYWSRAKRFIFVKRSSPAGEARVLIHELGHALDPELEQSDAAERETVAEATAFLVAAHFDMDTGERSFPYIATWASHTDGQAIIKRTMQRTQAIAKQLINGIEAALVPSNTTQSTDKEVAV